MKSNLNTADKVIRILFAIAVTVLYFTNVTSGTLGLVLLIGGGILLLTALISFCPIYWALGISTNKKEQRSI